MVERQRYRANTLNQKAFGGSDWVQVSVITVIREEHYKGLQWFISNPFNRAPFGILITKEDTLSKDDSIIAIPLKNLLILR